MLFGDRRSYEMTVGSLHHVELYVSDLNRSVAFWSWFLESLGYELYQSWEKGRSWKLNDTYIVFVQSELRFLDVSYHRCRVGLNHLAFHARSREHVDEVTVELRRQRISVLYQDRHPHAGGDGNYAVFFEDPDRIKVELVFG
jgi:catechol 2,3-dioxygenase-like lactoylglutathione lyase family enzyme